MKKVLLALLILVVAGVAAVPYVTGGVIEGRLKHKPHLPGLPKGMAWQVDHFDRGYLRSTATSTLTFHRGNTAPVVLHFKHEINQVPALDGSYATIHTEWVPQDPAVKSKLAEFFGDGPVVAIDTRMLLDGSTTSSGDIPAVDRNGLRFSGASMKADTSPSGHFTYHLEAAKMILDSAKLPAADGATQAKGKIEMRGLAVDSVGQVASDGEVWNGKGRIAVQQISGQGTPEGDIHMDGLVVHFQNARQGQNVSMIVGYGIRHFASAKVSFDNAQLKIKMSHLDAQALMRLQNQLEEVSNTASGNTQEQQQRVMGAVMMELPQLLDHGLRIDVDPFRADMAQGPVIMHLSAELPPHAMKGQASPLALINKLDIKGDLSVPVALLADAQPHAPGQPTAMQKLDPLVQKGYVTQKNGQITSTVTFSGGHLTINGVPADNLLASALSPH